MSDFLLPILTFLVGVLIGWVLGYGKRLVRDAHRSAVATEKIAEELAVPLPEEKPTPPRKRLVGFLIHNVRDMILVIALVVFGISQYQVIGANDHVRDIQHSQRVRSDCVSSVQSDVLAALSDRSDYSTNLTTLTKSVFLTQFHVILQAKKKLTKAQETALIQSYLTAIQKYQSATKNLTGSRKDHPYPAPNAISTCIQQGGPKK